MDLMLLGEKKLRSGRLLKRSWELPISRVSIWTELKDANSVELKTALYCEYLRKCWCKKGSDPQGAYWKLIKNFEDDVVGHIEDGWTLKWTTG